MDEKENKPKLKYHNTYNNADYIYDITFIGSTHFQQDKYIYYCDGYIFYNIANNKYLTADYIYTSVNKPSDKKRSTESTPAPSSSSSSEAR